MWARPATSLLDSNAGAPLRREVVEALLPLLRSPEGDGVLPLVPNPSSTHAFGQRAKSLLSQARERIARSMGASPEQITFTSSGTEANQQAIRSVLEPLLMMGAKPHWILTSVEHDCVGAMVRWLEERGGTASFLPVDSKGALRLEELPELFRPETALVSLIWVNNETGVIHDVSAAANVAQSRGVPVHLDGAQAWGKIPVELRSMAGVSFAAFAAHKLGSLPGTGVLWSREPRTVRPIFPGKQERGTRGGTENVLGIVAAGAAADALGNDRNKDSVRESRDRLEREILRALPLARIHGAGSPRVANTVNASFSAYGARDLVMALDLEGYSVSAGSACAAGSPEPSHVLTAMGCTREEALGSIRISLWEALPPESVVKFVETLARVVLRHSRGAAHASAGTGDSPRTSA